MQLNSHLHFNGECESAFKFYEKCLGGKITFMMPHEATPVVDQVSAAWRKKILRVTPMVGEQVLTGGDVPPEHYQKPQGLSVIIGLKDADEAERICNALAGNGTVQMPLQKTFWAVRFGMLVDRFGIPWMINCEKAA
jgi:PhnB protein